ncbi:hypothetical protein M011DRAFT_416039 [Sporormia fimetaria CBS 119925]|uniref:Protein transport protein sec73 n=1 Tax=Sporormia fimetaria CBS 119925 TaxID=1340428 RepID=A0A6A6VND8_9PLEO|nr:hypothetical protein M011DRAFT_416039 [Sporormia fimetaria CBS 119925]
MPLKGLRANRSDRDLNRRSTLDPAGFFKRADKSSHQDDQSENQHPPRIAVSEDGGRPRSSDVGSPVDGLLPSPPIQESTPATRRFSMMRFRHASDPQLSLKAKEHMHASDAPPPVPAMPTDTPAIITTAPTIVDHGTAGPKKRGRMQHFSLRRRSFDPSLNERSGIRKSMDKKHSSDIRRGPFSFMRSQHGLVEDSGTPATTQLLDPAAKVEPGQRGASAVSLEVPRASESSRSDGSSAQHVSFEQTPRPRPSPRTGSSRFGFHRKNKQRGSLFPLPMKISPPRFPNTAPATPRASTSGVSTGSPHHSPGGESPPPTAIHHPLANGENGANIFGPPAGGLGPAPTNLVASGAGLFRNDSTRSVRSARSSPNTTPMRLALRGRSSTMGSLGAPTDDPPPTPPYIGSGRTSTSTAPRVSFSNLFGLGAKFRQNADGFSPRQGSPAQGFQGTSGMLSQTSSLNISREALSLPEREEGETAVQYLERLEKLNLGKGTIASLLTKTDNPFYSSVLRSYMRKFTFFGDPIDMAIRKLLMQVELPKESQQIDRVLQGFAERYHECNPGIFIGTDKAYFLSFSIVILHTDVFNKNNKRKMQRQDYIKNSACEGVCDDVLGCFYDNIAYTPFIHIEDEVDLKNITSRRSKRTAVLKGAMHDPARKAAKEPIDPYALILEGKLDILRPNIKDVMNLDDPYSYLGTAPSLDIRTLYKSFSRYGVLQIVSSRSRPEAFMSQYSQDNPLESSVGIVEMPVTKIGVLWRKDAKRKKARSPWQEWGAVLTRSGLSLFRNSSWAKGLMHQHDQHQKHGDGTAVVFQPPLQEFKQDHNIPMAGAVALVDSTYKKHKNAFVLLSKAGEEVFLADNEKDLNDWLGMINYSAAFETLGVRPRGLIGGLYEGQRQRGIRRLESAHSTRSVTTATGEVTIQSGKIDKQFAQQVMSARRDLMQQRITESEERLTECIKQLEDRLRDARHLQILAPIQPKTRELVIHAAGRLAAKLKWARIEIWRMKCHRDILARELEDERQSTAEKLRNDGSDAIPQLTQPQLTPQQSKSSKISGLARLTSKASSLAGGQKPPVSPTTSVARPGTKSSRDTDFGEEVFKTPPETSQQPSPNSPSGQFTHLSFSPQTFARRASMASSSAQSPHLAPKEHRPSVSTVGDFAVSSDAASDIGSRYSTPPPTASGKPEPRTPEMRPADNSHVDANSDSEMDRSPAPLTPESKTKARRSLHRTLRDSHTGSLHRRHKARDSASTIISDDTQESEGLSRARGSFTVHGKKASVITFGLDWHNMPAEERLKIKKQAQEAREAREAQSEQAGEKEDHTDGRPRSIISEDALTITSTGTAFADESTEAKKQRHVSSQTITPATFRRSTDGHLSDELSEVSEVEEASSDKDGVPPKTEEDTKKKSKDDGGASSGRMEEATAPLKAVEA